MKHITLKHHLNAAPTAKDFQLLDTDRPQCQSGGVLVKVHYISIDPYIGHLLNKGHMGQTAPQIGTEKIPGAIVGEVIESQSDTAKIGDFVYSMSGGWAQYAALPMGSFQIINPKAAPLESYIGVLGMPGLTAWAGVTQLAKVAAGDIFAVNAAAGPVGGTAGQIARMKGAKTIIGIAGGAQKCAIVKESYGFTHAVDYKTEHWQETYKAAAPDGINVHYENVGAEQLGFAMQNLQLYGRVILCGLAAHYHASEPAKTLIGPILGKRAAIYGLVVYDYMQRWDEFRDELAPWVQAGDIKIIHDSVKGLEAAGGLMEKLMAGKNIGKCVVDLT